MRFFLGTHVPCWLGRVDIPLMVSHRTLGTYRTLPEARGPWVLDSLAWSFSARYDRPMLGHTHKTCANCLPYALRWRDRLLRGLDERAGDDECEQLEMVVGG